MCENRKMKLAEIALRMMGAGTTAKDRWSESN
jgi:hypothetical protein